LIAAGFTAVEIASTRQVAGERHTAIGHMTGPA
jgi:hypothetical protein